MWKTGITNGLGVGIAVAMAGCSTSTTAPFQVQIGQITGQVINAATETGLAGWQVFVDRNGDGRLSPGESVSTTDAAGRFQLSSLGPTPVSLVLQTGWDAIGVENRAIPRIVGGTDVPQGKYPWLVQLNLGGDLCGGTLIRPNWVLTAAHCLAELGGTNQAIFAPDIDVLVGSVALDGGRAIGVTQAIIFPDYAVGSRGELIQDVALLHLAEAVDILPVPLAMPAEVEAALAAGQLATVAGWGATSEGGDVPETLQEVSLPLVTNAACANLLQEFFTITDVMLCAGGQEGFDSCQGDSGGPLFLDRPTGGFVQIGVVSYGAGCARPNLPGVYARVTSPESARFIANTPNLNTTLNPTIATPATVTFRVQQR